MTIRNLNSMTHSALAMQVAEYVNTPEDEIYDKIVKYFLDNPNPKDFDIHKFAEENDMAPAVMEDHIYHLFTNFVRTLGRHNDVPDSLFFTEQLEMGIKEELEHTDSQYLAKLIAKDHLSQDPLYYSHHNIEEDAYLETASYEELSEAEKDSKKEYLNRMIKSFMGSIDHIDSMKEIVRAKSKLLGQDESDKAKREKNSKEIERLSKKQEQHRDKVAKLREQLRKHNEKLEKDKERARKK